jgi:hypothetical protein
MWRDVGIVRTGDGLAHAAERLHGWAEAAPAPTDLDGYELNDGLADSVLNFSVAAVAPAPAPAPRPAGPPPPAPK